MPKSPGQLVSMNFFPIQQEFPGMRFIVGVPVPRYTRDVLWARNRDQQCQKPPDNSFQLISLTIQQEFPGMRFIVGVLVPKYVRSVFGGRNRDQRPWKRIWQRFWPIKWNIFTFFYFSISTPNLTSFSGHFWPYLAIGMVSESSHAVRNFL